MLELRELYQEVIIDHNKNPRNFHMMTAPTHQAEGFNPLCGDQLKLYLQIENNKIKAVSFEGQGCAISTASASLMTEAVMGKTLPEALQLFEYFHQLMLSKENPSNSAILGKLEVLKGVRAFPSRVKCATLPWHTFKAACDQQQMPASTE